MDGPVNRLYLFLPGNIAGIYEAVGAIVVSDGIAFFSPVLVDIDDVPVFEGMITHECAARLRLEYQVAASLGFDCTVDIVGQIMRV